jgi:hypothetical protein
LRRREGARWTNIYFSQITQSKKREDLSNGPDEPWVMPLISAYPVASKTLHAFVLIDNGFPILIQIDDAHGANRMAVTASDTFFLIDFHYFSTLSKKGL